MEISVKDKLDRNHLEPHAASQRARGQLIKTRDLCDETCTKVTDSTPGLMVKIFLCLWHDLIDFIVFNTSGIFKFCKIVPVGFSDQFSSV